MNLYNVSAKDIYAIGDLHGYFESLKNWIQSRDITDSAIIVCGDIGFGFEKPGYYEQLSNKFEKVCSERNVTVFMFRGNHDDPSYFYGGNKIDTEHFKAIPDYSVITNGEHNVLCVGGAISIDRTLRIANMRQDIYKYAIWHNCPLDVAEEKVTSWTYWKDEKPYFLEDAIDEIQLNDIKIDIVCTHDSPPFCPPLTKDGISGYLNNDKTLEQDIDESRDVFSKILNRLIADKHPLKRWVYGHYHFHDEMESNGVIYTLLDMYRVNNNKFDYIRL